MRRCVIMQPAYLPWLGYFDLVDQSDCFIFLDDVQFSKQSWQQRNRIRTAQGLTWLTVPVNRKLGTLIADMTVASPEFGAKHLRTITQAYSRAPYFNQIIEPLVNMLEAQWRSIADLNIALIEWLCRQLGINLHAQRSSAMGISGARTERLAAFCQSQGASVYLSPIGSADYLFDELTVFEKHGIAVEFHHYEHPVYEQLYAPFIPYASVIDLLFNLGPNALSVLRSGRRQSYTPGQIRERKKPSP